MTSIPISTNAQTAEDQNKFELRVKEHVDQQMKTKDWKALIKAGHEGHGHMWGEIDIENEARSYFRHSFIIDNLSSYNRAYFGPKSMNPPPITNSVCDNGGFEDDFDYLEGFMTTFNQGSETCEPTFGGQPSMYVPHVMPAGQEFEIMSVGIDPITQLDKVKFGEKSLRVNGPYLHDDYDQSGGRPGDLCSGQNSVNKVERQFLVDANNREFTIWYSVAIENPSGHNDSQPFFNISCDLAPDSELCFDAEILQCDSTYFDALCVSPESDGFFDMKVLDWTCHRIIIPEEKIGEIATLEIVVGDCGFGGHNGYAYIDGICEECTGSALGSLVIPNQEFEAGLGIDYFSCNGDIATICGNYTKPTICDEWDLSSIEVRDYVTNNITIDSINQIFCFDLPIENFGTLDQLELNAAGIFQNEGGGILPVVFSNSIDIFKELYQQTEIFAMTGDCFSNGDGSNISDDYYYVDFNISSLGELDYTIYRQLDNPYPNESGRSKIFEGYADGSQILGPFLIQEGSWELSVEFEDCILYFPVYPPDYCSGCSELNDIEITNITCTPDENGGPDTWGFDILVNNTTYTNNTYNVIGLGGASGINFNTWTSFVNLPLGLTCFEYEITFPVVSDCRLNFTVCPPKPCNPEARCDDLEVSITALDCIPRDANDRYDIDLEVENNNEGFICYDFDQGGISSTPSSGNLVIGSNTIGPMDGSGTLIVKICPFSDCTTNCNDPDCFKIIKVDAPDCDERETEKSEGKFELDPRNSITDWYRIAPNPAIQGTVNIFSQLEKGNVFVYDLTGKLIKSQALEKGQNSLIHNDPSGLYLLKLTQPNGDYTIEKIIINN